MQAGNNDARQSLNSKGKKKNKIKQNKRTQDQQQKISLLKNL